MCPSLDHNLIKAFASLKLNQQAIIGYVVLQIKPEDNMFNFYEINISDFALLYQVPVESVFDEFAKLVSELAQKGFWHERSDKAFYFTWFSEAEYILDKRKIKVMLNSNIFSSLLRLKNLYTESEIWSILQLKGKYSLSLYNILKGYKGETKLAFRLESLKEMLEIKGYNNYGDFKKRVLEPAIREISLCTDTCVSFDKVTRGREHKVDLVVFNLKNQDLPEKFRELRELLNSLKRFKDDKNLRGQMAFGIDGNIILSEK